MREGEAEKSAPGLRAAKERTWEHALQNLANRSEQSGNFKMRFCTGEDKSAE